MSIQEVLTPHLSPIDITRCDEWTHVAVHPGTLSPEIAQELAARLDPDSELGSWITPFAGHSVSLRELRADPLPYLGARNPALLRLPCLAHYIPRILRVPWANL